jgi:hypothetical protein
MCRSGIISKPNSAFTEMVGVGYRIRNAELRGNRRPSLDFLSKCGSHGFISLFSRSLPYSAKVYSEHFLKSRAHRLFCGSGGPKRGEFGTRK